MRTSGIVFQHAFGAWVKGVKVQKSCPFSVYMPQTKYGEVRDSEFHDAWWKGGGGTAYAGLETSYDCLMTGVRTTAPNDAAHGHIGPRNVVYRCKMTSPKDGLVLSGMNEGWIIVYNHFVVENGRAIVAQEFSFDHQVVGNLIEIKDLSAPAIRMTTPDCGGWEITGNRFKGVPADKYVGGWESPSSYPAMGTRKTTFRCPWPRCPRSFFGRRSG
jgi:hypothetical protein